MTTPQRVMVAVKATRDCHETSGALSHATQLSPQAGEPADEAGVIHMRKISAGAFMNVRSSSPARASVA